jgi:hypothetical protein
MSHETVAQIVDLLLEVLGEAGVPGAPLARRAVQAIEGLRRDQAARQRLQALLQQAEDAFIQEARRQGLEAVAQWVTMLPQQNRPLFQQALQTLLQRWDETDLQRVLEQALRQIPGLEQDQLRRALSLYLRLLRAHLIQDEAFHQVIVGLSILRTEARVDALYEAISALRGLPEDLVAWPVQSLDASRISELRADLLLARYRLVPYTGKAFRETLKDLLAWARGLEAAQPPVGLRTYIGPGGAGKTRLLIEAGEALRREGWWAGFLRAGRLTPENARLLTADPRPTLLIVDYIANRAEEVRTLLREAARAREERAAPLALVLLERTFPTGWKRTFRTTPTPNMWAGRPSSASPRWRGSPDRCRTWTRRTVGSSSGRPGRGSRRSSG